MVANAPKISVIVPVYNAEKHMRPCVDSLLSQTLADIEVILVDDGSTDGSGKICDEYAGRDGRVRAVHQANGRQGKARNAGASIARGEYIGFADGDDLAHPEMFGTLYRRAVETGADIAMCDYAKSRSPDRAAWNGKSRMDRAFLAQETFNKDTIAHEPAKKAFFSVAVCWNKIFRRDFYLANVRFPEGMVFEDAAPMFSAFARAKSIAAVDRKLYLYRCSGAGSSSHSRDRRAFDLFKTADMIISDMTRRDYGKFAGFAVRSSISDILHHFKRLDTNLRSEYYMRLKELAEKLSARGLDKFVAGKDGFRLWCVRHAGYAVFRLCCMI
ncbi:MAG: glycosyltransferase [Rickettsiales bacterium]|jgi:glycosyltransferase involved in cell wall biosynthesis|nr:glycosyltransferase [Rickettsiales bacterium]